MNYQHVIQKLKNLVQPGLVSGLGKPNPGEMCIEAAVSLALGEKFTDKPSCVADPDRRFAIRLNDAPWSSNQARAEAMLPLGIAQLGTAGQDRSEWLKYIQEQTIRRILPPALCAAADKHPDPKHQQALRKAANRCKREGGVEAAKNARAAGAAAARAADADAAYAAAYAADAAAAAAYAAAAYVADAAAAYADAAYAYAAYAAYADAAAARAADRDVILKEAVKIALEAYRQVDGTIQ